MVQHGGKRNGAGRKPGAVSKAKRALSDMAKDSADAALHTLVEVMQDPEQPGAARISAANAILDRGYGKPPQSLDHTSTDGTMSPPTIVQLIAAKHDSSDD